MILSIRQKEFAHFTRIRGPEVFALKEETLKETAGSLIVAPLHAKAMVSKSYDADQHYDILHKFDSSWNVNFWSSVRDRNAWMADIDWNSLG
jgi:antibiotic biosynthesis monooxygenase (ABM) superfamily enzyme